MTLGGVGHDHLEFGIGIWHWKGKAIWFKINGKEFKGTPDDIIKLLCLQLAPKPLSKKKLPPARAHVRFADPLEFALLAVKSALLDGFQLQGEPGAQLLDKQR